MKARPSVKHTLLLSTSALALAVASASHAFEFEAGDTTATIYGFAKLDMIYDVDNDLGGLAARPRILIDGQPGSDGHTTMHAYESRIGFRTVTPAGGSQLRTQIEVDWFDNAPDGGDLRLRHAFGSWNGILAGKTWTNFGSLLGMTPTVDLAPQPGQSKIGRKAQLRYSWQNWHVALENPDPEDYTDTVARGFNPARGGYVAQENAKTGLPDLTLRYQSQAAGLPLRGALTWGDGIGEYLQNNPSAPGYWDGERIETIEAWGANVGMSLTAGPGAINLGYGISKADLDDALEAGLAGVEGANERFEAVHLNYIWSPMERVSYGIEAGYHTRKVANGRDGDALRLQGMVRYDF